MSNQNKNRGIELFFFNSIIKEKFLFITILIIFFLLSFTLTFVKKKKFKEYQSQVIIKMATNDFFFPSYYINSPQNDKSLEKFNNDFVVNLISLTNLNNFLNQPNNFKYLQVLKKNQIDLRDYFKNGNFTFIKNNNLFYNNNLIKIFFMTYPSDFNFEDFFRDYLSFISDMTSKEYVSTKLNYSNNKLLLLEKAYDLNKNDTSKKLPKLSSRIKSYSNMIEREDFFSDENVDVGNFPDLYMSENQIIRTVEFIKEINKLISNFYFQPVYDIVKTEKINNLSYKKNILISLVLGFLTFFFIVVFKEFFKKYLR